MSELQEYVERVVGQGFSREAEADENVMRSLPFFATALGLLATVFGLMHGTVGRPDRSPFSVSIYAAVLCLAASVGLSILFLLRAIRPRPFTYPMPEGEFVEYAARVAEAHRAGAPAGHDPGAIERAAIADLRAARIGQLAEAAEANRRNNLERHRARGLALTALIAAIFFAFLLLALIFTRDTLAVGVSHA